MQHITIMTEEEYEMYRDFLKQRATLEANVTKGYDDLLVEHLRLCSAVLSAFEEETRFYEAVGRKVRRIQIRDQSAAAVAVTLARKYFEA